MFVSSASPPYLLSQPLLSHVIQSPEHFLDCANLFLVRAHLSGDRYECLAPHNSAILNRPYARPTLTVSLPAALPPDRVTGQLMNVV
jgi:hypothetical protein